MLTKGGGRTPFHGEDVHLHISVCPDVPFKEDTIISPSAIVNQLIKLCA